MNSQDQEVFDFLRRRGTTTTPEVVVEKPVIVERDDCPPCPLCEENKVIKVDTLHIKNDGNILVKPKNANSSTDFIYGDACEIHTPQEVVAGRFAITSLYNIEPSHIPPTFTANPNYPKGCNERDYRRNTQEQGKVVKYASAFNPKFLINDDNTPANGAIIIDEKGIVLGGNGRTMMLLFVIKEFPVKFKKYIELLKNKAGNFGIDIGKIEKVEFPVLVRVINTDSKKNCNYYSRIFNENMNNKLDDLDLAISYVKSLGKERVSQIAKTISQAIFLLKIVRKTSLKEVMNEKEVLPYLLQVLNDAKLINDTNRSTYTYFAGKRELLTESAVPLIKNIFYAMIFEDRQTILYAKSNPNIKVEWIFGNLIEIKAFDGIFNIIPQFKSAIEKIALNQSSTEIKLNADDIYSQKNMFDEWRVKYIEYLCMRLIELPDKEQQQNVLTNYIRLERDLRHGFWQPKNKSEITPEKLLEMSFDNAKVRHKLNNLGDRNKTVFDRIIIWFKNDFQKPYRWEK